MRDFTTIISICGKTAVALNTWRNSAGTAFASVTIADPWNSGTTYEAKSQGPSAGGYHKPTQALERLTRKLAQVEGFGFGALSTIWDYLQKPETWAQRVAVAADVMRINGQPRA